MAEEAPVDCCIEIVLISYKISLFKESCWRQFAFSDLNFRISNRQKVEYARCFIRAFASFHLNLVIANTQSSSFIEDSFRDITCNLSIE